MLGSDSDWVLTVRFIHWKNSPGGMLCTIWQLPRHCIGPALQYWQFLITVGRNLTPLRTSQEVSRTVSDPSVASTPHILDIHPDFSIPARYFTSPCTGSSQMTASDSTMSIVPPLDTNRHHRNPFLAAVQESFTPLDSERSFRVDQQELSARLEHLAEIQSKVCLPFLTPFFLLIFPPPLISHLSWYSAPWIPWRVWCAVTPSVLHNKEKGPDNVLLELLGEYSTLSCRLWYTTRKGRKCVMNLVCSWTPFPRQHLNYGNCFTANHRDQQLSSE